MQRSKQTELTSDVIEQIYLRYHQLGSLLLYSSIDKKQDKNFNFLSLKIQSCVFSNKCQHLKFAGTGAGKSLKLGYH